MIRGGTAEGETLIEIVAELAVVVHVDGSGIVFISAYHHRALAEKETPVFRRPPIDIHHVGGIEHVLLVEHLLVQLLADTVVYIRADMPEHLEVEILSYYLTVVYAVLGFLMEGGPHVEEQVVHLVLCKGGGA